MFWQPPPPPPTAIPNLNGTDGSSSWAVADTQLGRAPASNGSVPPFTVVDRRHVYFEPSEAINQRCARRPISQSQTVSGQGSTQQDRSSWQPWRFVPDSWSVPGAPAQHTQHANETMVFPSVGVSCLPVGGGERRTTDIQKQFLRATWETHPLPPRAKLQR